MRLFKTQKLIPSHHHLNNLNYDYILKPAKSTDCQNNIDNYFEFSMCLMYRAIESSTKF